MIIRARIPSPVDCGRKATGAAANPCVQPHPHSLNRRYVLLSAVLCCPSGSGRLGSAGVRIGSFRASSAGHCRAARAAVTGARRSLSALEKISVPGHDVRSIRNDARDCWKPEAEGYLKEIPTPMSRNPFQHLYGSRRWRRAAARRLREFPLCSACLRKNLVVPAQEADHIVRHGGKAEAFWCGPQGLNSLCRACHEAKSAAEEGRKRRGFGLEVDDSGYPLDEAHPFNGGKLHP